MKPIKTIILLLFFCLFCAFPVCAEETDDFYREQLRNSGIDEIQDAVPPTVREYFSENGIDLYDENWISSFTAENIFSHIRRFLKEGAAAPLAAGGALLAVILIAAAIHAAEPKRTSADTAEYAAAIASAILVLLPAVSVIRSSIDALKGISVFLLSFIPVFAVITAAAGGAATAASMSALLLTAAEGVSAFSSFVISPLMGGYLALSISAAVSPVVKKSGLAEAVKKISLWGMGLISTVFTAILGIQTAVNAPADTLTMKTAKFIVGSAVPMAGSALSEALSTISASMGFLRSSVGIYGAAVCLLTFLPLILELLLWRAVMLAGSAAAELFSLSGIGGILKAMDAMLAVLTGILLLVGAMFIICLAVVIAAGRAA